MFIADHRTDSRYVGWPTQDRLAWKRAVAGAPADFLDDRPRLAAWAPGTQRNARNAVSALLRWLKGKVPLPLEGSLAHIVAPELLLAYIQEILPTHSPGTVKYSVFLIDGALRVFAPDRDWAWITKMSRGLEARARRHEPAPRLLIHAAVLYDVGVQVMEQAWSAGADINPSRYRSGLAVALLAAAPMRIANFAALEIERHLRRDGDHWTVYLAASETKTRRADVWPIAPGVGPYLDYYLTALRPALLNRAQPAVPTARLWIGDSGRPVGDQILRRWIGMFTQAHLGMRINPHTFRHCAATTFALERPHNSLQSSALLGHTSPQTTERHYIIQQRQIVQEDYLRLLHTRSRSTLRPEQ